MTLGPSVIAPPKTINVRVALEPALNALNSLSMLNFVDRLSGLDDWVIDAAQLLTPEQLRLNQLIISVLYDATMIDEQASHSFPTYLDFLAKQPPEVMSRRVIDGLLTKTEGNALKADDLLSSPEGFIGYVQQISDTGGSYHVDLLMDAYGLLSDPPALKQQILDHLGWAWKNILADEWSQVEPLLGEAVAAFRDVNLKALGFSEAFRFITGRDIGSELDSGMVPENVVFVPSAHIGPYITLYERSQVLRICFGARSPSGFEGISSQLNRSQLLVWLNALADDTRLSILELIATEGEICAQDIIARFDLSQSSASRHLRQLRAAGYLTERRRDGANKCYSLNSARVEEMISALKTLLLHNH